MRIVILRIKSHNISTVIVLAVEAECNLWPSSREGHPKPFIKLADGVSLIQAAYERARALGCSTLTVTNRDYYFLSRDEQDRMGIHGDFLLVPCGRKTASAIALAAHHIVKIQGADIVMLVLPADHLINDQDRFAAAVSKARQLADDSYLVTFGIVPTGLETSLEPAREYLAAGNYLLSSGMFCFKAGIFLEELKKHAPEVARAADACWQAMQPLANPAMAEIPEKLFKSIPDISVDYAVMERSDKVAVVPGGFGWSDIGSWNAIRDLIPADAENNRAIGETIFIDSRNTFVQSEGRLVATVGVDNLMIIDTADALLVAHPDKAQDVNKKVVARLKQENHYSTKLHRTVSRPWGTYTVLEEHPGFKIKRIEVKPGGSLSLQMHHHRSEHWVVVSGSARITNGEAQVVIGANQSTYIPTGQKHRLENPGDVPCTLIEVQCGSYLGEDDIVRFEDVYGRGWEAVAATPPQDFENICS